MLISGLSDSRFPSFFLNDFIFNCVSVYGYVNMSSGTSTGKEDTRSAEAWVTDSCGLLDVGSEKLMCVLWKSCKHS